MHKEIVYTQQTNCKHFYYCRIIGSLHSSTANKTSKVHLIMVLRAAQCTSDHKVLEGRVIKELRCIWQECVLSCTFIFHCNESYSIYDNKAIQSHACITETVRPMKNWLEKDPSVGANHLASTTPLAVLKLIELKKGHCSGDLCSVFEPVMQDSQTLHFD